jgi:hypothetical protein
METEVLIKWEPTEEKRKSRKGSERMIRPDFGKWGQNAPEILKLSLEAEHKRTRERYQALYMIGTEQTNATQWAQQLGRQDVTVMNWVHKYNEHGPDGIEYRHSGGQPPFLSERGSRSDRYGQNQSTSR